MTDEQLSAIAAGFKTVIQEQVLALRTQIADLRADLDAERHKSAEHRLFEAEARSRTMKMIGELVGDAIGPLQRRVGDFERRAVELEQRSMGAPS